MRPPPLLKPLFKYMLLYEPCQLTNLTQSLCFRAGSCPSQRPAAASLNENASLHETASLKRKFFTGTSASSSLLCHWMKSENASLHETVPLKRKFVTRTSASSSLLCHRMKVWGTPKKKKADWMKSENASLHETASLKMKSVTVTSAWPNLLGHGVVMVAAGLP